MDYFELKVVVEEQQRQEKLSKWSKSFSLIRKFTLIKKISICKSVSLSRRGNSSQLLAKEKALTPICLAKLTHPSFNLYWSPFQNLAPPNLA